VFDTNLVVLAVIGLAMLSAGGAVYALLYDRFDGESKAKRRVERIVDPGTKVEEIAGRKRSLQDALKDFEEKQKALEERSRRPPLSLRLTRAGLGWSKRTFVLVSIGTGLGTGLLFFFLTGIALVGIGGLVIGFLGMPNWLIAHLARRRQKAFVAELPTAVDLIVRGIRSGLPLGDCLRMVVSETKDPVAGEFRQIIENQHLGVPVGEACQKLYERMPIQEANFFGIVIAIQQKAGGNLSEALSNLSRVIRDRRKMKDKITAMSMEAKSSAAIIGSLPIIVAGLVYLTSPSYILLLFRTTAGNVILIGSALVMLIGVLVMKKMISFDI
jgi:tight adherence protein B